MRKPRSARGVPLSGLYVSVLAAACFSVNAFGQNRIQISYLGNAGWQITDEKTVVLVDPYLSRLKLQTPNDPVLADDKRPTFTRDDIAVSDEPTIDAHIQHADFILVTHTHLDHALDVPYIAKKTGATVIGTESTINYPRASGVPESQLFAVRGGEDLEFGAFSTRIVPSLHGILRRAPNTVPNPGPPPPDFIAIGAKLPFLIRDFAEGGTLAYL